MKGQRAGRSFVTAGPMLEMTVNDLQVGDTLRLDAPGNVVVKARAQWSSPLGTLEVIVNGRVVQTAKPASNPREIIFEGRIPLERSGWLAVRCTPPNSSLGAHMNPIYIELADRPAEARADAEFLLKWIDRLEADLRRRDRLPGSGLDHARMQLDAARAVYRKWIK